MDTRESPVSFRDSTLEPDLKARAGGPLSRGKVAARDLARYYNILSMERARWTFTAEEILLLVDVLNNPRFDRDGLSLWLAVRHAVERGETAWVGSDEISASLMSKLQKLSLAGEYAVLDQFQVPRADSEAISV